MRCSGQLEGHDGEPKRISEAKGPVGVRRAAAVVFIPLGVLIAIQDFVWGYVDGDLEPKVSFVLECLGLLGTGAVLGNTETRPGVWYYVVAVKNSTDITIYINGFLEDRMPLATFSDSNSTNLKIGSNAREGAYLNGLAGC